MNQNNSRIHKPNPTTELHISSNENSINEELLSELRSSIQEYQLKVALLESKNKALSLLIMQAVRRISDIQSTVALAANDYEKIRTIFGSKTWRLANSLRKMANRKNEDLITLSVSLEQNVTSASQAIQSTLLETSRQSNTNIPLSIPNRRLKPTEFGFIQISPIPWNCDLFQRPQQMCIAASKLGIPTSYISAFTQLGQPDSEIAGQFLSETPIYVGTSNDLVAELKNNIVSFYSTDLFPFPALQALRASGNVIIYEYVDAIDSRISEQAQMLELRHKYLIDPNTVDYVVTTARILEAEMLERFPRDRVIYLPNAVNDEDFMVQKLESEFTPNLKGWITNRDKSRKVIGYVGAIAQWLDYEFVSNAAKQNPDIDFVFVGPIYDEFTKKRIATAPNIIYLGLIPYELVPEAVKQFDVCWIPFEDGEIAKSTSPLKLFEYFAAGKPTLTPISMLECSSFSEVLTYDSQDSFKQSLEFALSKSLSAEFSEHLKSVARENTWSNRIKTLFHAISNAE
jgi:hypothetical protein